MSWEYRIDESRTAAAYQAGTLRDQKQRSYFNNTGHVFLRGLDRADRWMLLYHEQKGRCAECGKWRLEDKLDLDHMKGHTAKTRCDCYQQTLIDGTECTGVRLVCTLDVRKGGNPDSCHGRKHVQVRFGENANETHRRILGRD
jgi:hypothetical protein